MQEFHDNFIPDIMEFIRCGNTELKKSAVECLTKALQYQYNS